MFKILAVVKPKSKERKCLYCLYQIIVAAMNINENVYCTTLNAFRIVTFFKTLTDETSFRTFTALIFAKNKAGKKPAIIPTTTANKMKYAITVGVSSRLIRLESSGAMPRK